MTQDSISQISDRLEGLSGAAAAEMRMDASLELSELARQVRLLSPSNVPDAIALLEECLVNGDAGPQQLYAWFINEHNIIQDTIIDGKKKI